MNYESTEDHPAPLSCSLQRPIQFWTQKNQRRHPAALELRRPGFCICLAASLGLFNKCACDCWMMLMDEDWCWCWWLIDVDWSWLMSDYWCWLYWFLLFLLWKFCNNTSSVWAFLFHKPRRTCPTVHRLWWLMTNFPYSNGHTYWRMSGVLFALIFSDDGWEFQHSLVE